jgi:hypothetical protein
MKTHAHIEGVRFDVCQACGSIVAEEPFLDRVRAGTVRPYDESYWAFEMKAAEQRCFGSSIPRVAELFRYARRPIHRFLDVSAGSGRLLDALAILMPEQAGIFHAIEPFPPPEEWRSRHPNYRVGFIRDLDGLFDAGTCIEVIEHLPPDILRSMLQELAAVSEDGAVWYFNSAQPSSAEVREQGYLDPLHRGHIASYSLEGLAVPFREAGFTIQPLHGREWAFLAIRGEVKVLNGDELQGAIWKALPENEQTLTSPPFGPLLHVIGLESASFYATSHIMMVRTRWALSLLGGRDSWLTGLVRRMLRRSPS